MYSVRSEGDGAWRRNQTSDGCNGAGVTYYLKASGAGAYVSPSLLVSLDRDWRSGTLTEVGFRGRLHGRVNGRLGAAVLTPFDRQVPVNPTIGLDVKLGAAR
jgi:hypothetical protein